LRASSCTLAAPGAGARRKSSTVSPIATNDRTAHRIAPAIAAPLHQAAADPGARTRRHAAILVGAARRRQHPHCADAAPEHRVTP